MHPVVPRRCVFVQLWDELVRTPEFWYGAAMAKETVLIVANSGDWGLSVPSSSQRAASKASCFLLLEQRKQPG